MSNCYTFYNIEFQVEMCDADKVKKFEKWLTDKFAREDDVMLPGFGGNHTVNHIDFRGKPCLSFESVGQDGFKNHLVVCGESVSDMCMCMYKFNELVSGTTITFEKEQEENSDVIRW